MKAKLVFALKTILIASVLLLAAFGVSLIQGCASLQAGADPIVVRAEQAESGAKSTIDLVWNIDNTDRAFWRTNAPAFHSFVEYLREPVNLGTNTLPRGYGFIYSVDFVKQDYKAGRASSNALMHVVTTLEGVMSQASAWLTIATNTPAH